MGVAVAQASEGAEGGEAVTRSEAEAKVLFVKYLRSAWDDMSSEERWETLLRALNFDVS